MCQTSRSTFSAYVAPNLSALRALSVTPCARPNPIAMRHAASTATIATISEMPKNKVAMPAGFVKKKRAMSTSATTRSDVPARNR